MRCTDGRLAPPVFDNHGRLFGSISLCCLAEERASPDLLTWLSRGKSVTHCSPTACCQSRIAILTRCTGLLESMDDGVMAWNEQEFW